MYLKGRFIMKKKVLILCTGNSCRSQMAEGILRTLGSDRFEVYSAGVNPTAVNPLSIKVMSETGIDISPHRSKSAEEFSGQRFDYVITVCDNARQTCPAFPGEHEKLHWDLEDPAEATGTEEEILNEFRRIRDLIYKHVEDFIKKSI
jgi:arsenate reductase